MYKKLIFSAALSFVSVYAMATTPAPPFTLSSGDFKANDIMPDRVGGNTEGNIACRGENISPSLSWKNIPKDTQSLALIVHDAEGRNGLGVTHLVAYDIPVTTSEFASGALSGQKGFVGGQNTSGKNHYVGPCPPLTVDTHHYTFTLIATDLPVGTLPANLNREALLDKLQGHALGAAGIVGGYGPAK